MNILLETKELSKIYKNNKGIEDINIKVEKGDIYGFLGPNGSGKTTTIRTILNLIHADRGAVNINGFDTKIQFEKAIENVGAIVETPTFYDYLSGRDNLKVIAKLYKHVTRERIDDVLEMVGLNERGCDKVKTYSLGMKQRLGIARALIHNPKLVILDEPTNGLDPQGMKEVREMIKKLAHENDITFLISTHLLNEVEQICNKVGILKNGRMIVQGFVKDLLAEDIETVEVRTSDRERALKVSDKVDFIRNAEPSNNGIIYRIDKGYSNYLNRLLIENNIEVDYLIPKGQSLENYFFDVMKGENENGK